MKKTQLIAIFLCAALSCASTFAKTGVQLDNIVAVVNDDVVTQTELDHALFVMKAQIAATHAANPTKQTLQQKALNQLVNKKLQLQLAKQAGIAVEDTEIDTIVNRVASQNNLSITALYERINQEGMSTSSYRTDLREQLTIQRLQQQAVGGRIAVTPEEINNFMTSHPTPQRNVEKVYHLEDLLVPVADDASASDIAAAKKVAEALTAKLKQGETVKTVAENEKTNKVEPNDLGWLKIEDVPSAFTDKVMSMQTDDVASPIQTGNGFHVLRLAETRAADGSSGAPDRKQVEQIIMQQKFEQHVQSWVSKMRGQAFIVMNTPK